MVFGLIKSKFWNSSNYYLAFIEGMSCSRNKSRRVDKYYYKGKTLAIIKLKWK